MSALLRWEEAGSGSASAICRGTILFCGTQMVGEVWLHGASGKWLGSVLGTRVYEEYMYAEKPIGKYGTKEEAQAAAKSAFEDWLRAAGLGTVSDGIYEQAIAHYRNANTKLQQIRALPVYRIAGNSAVYRCPDPDQPGNYEWIRARDVLLADEALEILDRFYALDTGEKP